MSCFIQRRSLLDVLKENFAATGRASYIHRLIYFGEHLFTDTQYSFHQIAELFQFCMHKIESEGSEDSLTGLLLYYPHYFLMSVEGPEESIIKHLKLLLEHELSTHLGKMKILVAYHHINQRFFKGFSTFSAKPPILLEKMESVENTAHALKHAKTCLKKLYALCLKIRNMSSSSLVSENLGEGFTETLPEYAVLEYLIQTPVLHDLTDYYEICTRQPNQVVFDENIWPIPQDFIPQNVFEEKMPFLDGKLASTATTPTTPPTSQQ